MANRDGTGPNGAGPMTGRGLGNCAPARGRARAGQVRPRLGRRR